MSSLFLVQTHVYNSNIATVLVNTEMLTIYFRCGSDINVINKRPWNFVSRCLRRISSVCYGLLCSRVPMVVTGLVFRIVTLFVVRVDIQPF